MLLGKLLKFTWKTINLIREIVVNLVFLLIILIIWGGWSLLKQQESLDAIPQEGILVLNIQGSIVDTTVYDQDIYKLKSKLNGNEIDRSRENSLFELTKKIEQATHDDNIRGIILSLDNFTGADMPSLQYVGKYLTAFRQANKPIYAIGSHYAQAQYYLASFADTIYLTPQGDVSVYGLSANNLYYKTLLDNLKINTHVFRVGTYKSAIEPFTRDNMSSAARENTRRWLNTMWASYLDDISAHRERQPNTLVPAPDVFLARLKEASGSLTDYARQNHLVDHIASNYEFNQSMQHVFNSLPQLSIYDYELKQATNLHPKSQIAVVFVNGAITGGNNSDTNAGSDTLTQQLALIRDTPEVQAVVLRINSPGGSVYASEAIRSEIEALRHKNIPVVVSMGGMAASGGYWIATESDYIIASPNTITGSIGIFGVIPTFENSLSHIGVYTDGVSTSPLAEMSLTKSLSEEANQLIQMNIESGYNSFINIVAKARGLTTQDVDKVGQGQVWLGVEAQKIGLVDQLGDFDDALAKAAELAKLDDYDINWLQQESSWFNAFFANVSASLPKSAVEVMYNQLPMSQQIKQHVALWDNLNDPQNRYIYCLNCADVK